MQTEIVCIRHCKREPQTRAGNIEDQHLASVDAVGFTPIGQDEPYRIIVQNNPVNKIDPLGLEGLTSTDVQGNYDKEGDPFFNNYDPNKTGCHKATDKCLEVFSECMSETLGHVANDAKEAGETAGFFYTASGWQHAGSRNLTYPLKSSIVRNSLVLGEEMTLVVPLGAFVGVEFYCLKKELDCANGH
jgi:hypothetical protein